MLKRLGIVAAIIGYFYFMIPLFEKVITDSGDVPLCLSYLAAFWLVIGCTVIAGLIIWGMWELTNWIKNG